MAMSSPAPLSARAARVRRGLIGVALGALLASVVTVLTATSSSTAPVAEPPRSAAAPTSTASPAERVFTQAAAGDCLTWSTPNASDLALTDCAQPHRFEVAADIDLSITDTTEFPAGAPLPGAVSFTALRDSRCAPAVDAYLQGRFDPRGLFSVGLIDPGEAAWRAGARTVRCGLQHVGRSGAQFPIQGRVGELDQSEVAPVGSCTNIAAGLPTDPVDCALPHAAEVLGVVDLTSKFPATYPTVAEQDAYLDETCRATAAAALGGPDAAAQKGFTVFWNTRAPESWAAGSRRVNCSAGKQLPGGGFAPVTGMARAAPATAPPPPPLTPPTAGR